MTRRPARRTPFAARAALTERHVQAMWYDGALRPDGLRAADGTPVRVLDPGAWNLEAGPDFRNAVLEIGVDRRRLTGDVEVHLRPADWTAHGHSADAAYAQVVAHVTWHARPPVPPSDALPAGCISICLGDILRTRPGFSPAQIDLAAYPYAHADAAPRPCERAFARDPDALLALLRAAGRRRLEQKACRIAARFARVRDRAQVFYEETMTALGYKHNTAPFRTLAETLPWRCLPGTRDAAFASLSCAAEMAVSHAAAWRRANVRPANSTERRLHAAADLFAGTHATLLPRLDACDLAAHDGQAAACTILCESHRLGAKRAAAILANVLVPFAWAENRLSSVPDRLLPEDVSEPVRRTAFRLMGRDHNAALYAGDGLLIQGLLQIQKDHCQTASAGCASCRLPLPTERKELPL